MGSTPLYHSSIDRLKQWINGPEFLQLSKDECPTFTLPQPDPDALISCFVQVREKNDRESSILHDLIVRHSSFNKLLHVVAYLRKFKLFLLGKSHVVESSISATDLKGQLN